MAASELAKSSLPLIMPGYLTTNFGNARRRSLSLKQPTGSYEGNAVSPVCRKDQISNEKRCQAVNKQYL